MKATKERPTIEPGECIRRVELATKCTKVHEMVKALAIPSRCLSSFVYS